MKLLESLLKSYFKENPEKHPLDRWRVRAEPKQIASSIFKNKSLSKRREERDKEREAKRKRVKEES